MRAGSQQGASASGGDLAIMMVVEVYNKAGWEIPDVEDAIARARKSKHGFLLPSFRGIMPLSFYDPSTILYWSMTEKYIPLSATGISEALLGFVEAYDSHFLTAKSTYRASDRTPA